jgi:putative flippase GtrA
MSISSLTSLFEAFLKGRLFKFFVSGTINTLVDWSSYFILFYALQFPNEEMTKAVSAFMGINSAFLFNTFWVFNDKFKSYRENHNLKTRKALFNCYWRVMAIYSLGMLVNVLIFSIVNRFSHMVLLSLFIATLFTLVFNYVFVKNAAYESMGSKNKKMVN